VRLGISRVHFPVTTLGPGRRIGLWLQGCSIHCPGCISRDTWPLAETDQLVEVSEVLRWFERYADDADGITISGGEPLDQSPAVEEFLGAIRRSQSLLHCDILLYTGYSIETAQTRSPGLLREVDALMSEPFIISQPTDLMWRGSENQILHTMSPRGRELFGPFVDARSDVEAFQFSSDGGHAWSIGIPNRRTLPALKRKMKESGVDLQECSWQV
jgi:anaerobic ribonucleoside-triphosphate reductase activating protein